ncbi:UDP-N-acetylmuramoyl-L-alanyl-D-glutamate--2,6-diaminopimelate ligase [Patescibacteria group bacterium]|nr:UDP-N-acetylmuramoyl-L-alanyl-D-glutamate--2,6-diaminopimelate ligase [Patescibacteria group bacterium]
MIHRLKKFIPESWLNAYHFALSSVATAWYRHPSESLIVIGVTGTNGKTTTSYLISKALEAMGDKTGCMTTALFKVDSKEWLNDKKMTMLGRFQLQKLLREIVDAGCKYVVVETSSQGIVQHRHRGVNYDCVVLTNLTPEHIEAHGSFKAYKDAKIELFRHAATSPRKVLNGKTIPKVAILPHASEDAEDFAVIGLDQVMWYGVGTGGGVTATNVEDHGWLTKFSVDGQSFELHLPGEVNVENATAAIAVAKSLGLPFDAFAKKLESIPGVPGRFERIDAGQPYTVLVDYAVEPVAMEKLYAFIKGLPHQRLIHVFGSCGGGRDVARRPILGKLAAEHVDRIVVTNEDPYDDDPQMIVDQIAAGARAAGATDERMTTILDRREAIEFAVKQAKPGDVVLITGKGCEQWLMVADGKRIPWDDRKVAKEAILRYASTHVSP